MNPRTIGHRWERKCVQYLSDVFGLKKKYQIATARAESKSLDDNGVDIWVAPDVNFPFYIQCKNQQVNGSIPKIDIQGLLNIKLKNKMPILFTRLVRKKNVSQQLIGEYVVLDMKDFLQLAKVYYDRNNDNSSK